ncbi:hypothetical protein Areg01_32170 [Actinoplanes regularis]|nr:hypothetical protein Areg01_32170 [Actinoplanes regularis]
MKKAKGLLMVAAGVVSGFALGAAPAQAAEQPGRLNVDVIGHFKSKENCRWVGKTGRAFGKWRVFDCDRSAFDPNLWTLTIYRLNRPGRPGGPVGPVRPGGPGAPGGPVLPGGPVVPGGPGLPPGPAQLPAGPALPPGPVQLPARPAQLPARPVQLPAGPAQLPAVPAQLPIVQEPVRPANMDRPMLPIAPGQQRVMPLRPPRG